MEKIRVSIERDKVGDDSRDKLKYLAKENRDRHALSIRTARFVAAISIAC